MTQSFLQPPPSETGFIESAGKVKHTCHWPGCNTEVPPAMWGCKQHWYKLPGHIRDQIKRHYRPGQERDKNPSANYIKAALEALDWIRKNDPA